MRTDPSAVSAPEPIRPDCELDYFASGVAALDNWLKRWAWRNEAGGGSRIFVLCQGRVVLGYYSLAAGSLLPAAATGRVRRNMPDPVPVILLGRLALDQRWHGRGLGVDLLRDAVLRVLSAGDVVGARAVLVHAISPGARAFYEKRGFASSPVDSMTLMITLQDARGLFSVA